MSRKKLTDLDEHFAFGENWQSFAGVVDEERVAEAARALSRLLPAAELDGRTFLDIGCGSGLSSLAALSLGAASVAGVDLDPASVVAARTLLSRWAEGKPWTVRSASIFDLSPDRNGTFDVVYSWGVLHHTGDMWPAMERAASLVAPGGQLAMALYRKTPLCRFWRRAKGFYSHSGPGAQRVCRALFKTAYVAGLVATGRNPRQYIAEYKAVRGMDWSHDVHDWLGGYPYESVSPQEVVGFLEKRGFAMVRMFEKRATAGGLFGSHCDEFVAMRAPRANVEASSIRGEKEARK